MEDVGGTGRFKPDQAERLGSTGNRADGFNSSVSFGLQNLAAPVKTGGADVVTQMNFARGRFNGGTGLHERIVRTVHTALGRRLLVLLNSHEILLGRRSGAGGAQRARRNREMQWTARSSEQLMASQPSTQDKNRTKIAQKPRPNRFSATGARVEKPLILASALF
jgi:hypothetical protein